MKLVDILARELKVWPENWGIFCVSSKVEGSFAAWFGYRNPVFVDGGWSDIGTVELWLSEEPEDRRSVVVRRFEWQAAVDALKAEKVPSAKTQFALEEAGAIRSERRVTLETILSSPQVDDPRMHASGDAAYERMSKIFGKWNGEGIPPVGTVCEWMCYNTEWRVGDIRYISDCTVVIGGENCEHVHHPYTCVFRPAKKPEQIAAERYEEDAAEIAKILSDLKNADDIFVAKTLLDCGYRKFEIVDN